MFLISPICNAFEDFVARATERNDALFSNEKLLIFSNARGTILEVGAGTGINAKYFPHADTVILSDPNPHIRRHLKDPKYQEITCFGEQLPYGNSSIDVIVSSFALCSVRNLPAVLNEITRVLRPGGTFRFIEHVGAPDGTALRRVQGILQPVYKILDGGCQLTRDIESSIRTCGLIVRRLDRIERDIGTPIVKHFIFGIAEKSV